MKISTWAISLLMLLSPSYALKPNHSPQIIVWDVGQGQWVTHSASQFCLHIDAGGEFAPFEKIKKECKAKRNMVAPSHLDHDHISFLNWIYWNLESPCLVRPLNVSKNKRSKLDEWRRWPSCDQESLALAMWQRHWPDPPGKSKKNSNSWSAIDVFRETTLLTGDSPQKMEKRWMKKIDLSMIQRFLLGHHGSITSSSTELLKKLPTAHLAIASARQKRYGHPHSTIQKRLRHHGISLLRTEIWGSIRWRASGD